MNSRGTTIAYLYQDLQQLSVRNSVSAD